MGDEIKTTYVLEMAKSEDLSPKGTNLPGWRIERLETPCPEFNKFLHTVVGYEYRWGGRTHWGKDTWYAYASRKELETWVAYLGGTPAGYFELEKRPGGDIEVKSLGLLPSFIGQGLGGPLLTRAAERAWEIGASKVWLTTCSHDHPHALQNYLDRGFQIREIREGPANRPIASFWEGMVFGPQVAG